MRLEVHRVSARCPPRDPSSVSAVMRMPTRAAQRHALSCDEPCSASDGMPAAQYLRQVPDKS